MVTASSEVGNSAARMPSADAGRWSRRMRVRGFGGACTGPSIELDLIDF